MRRHRIRNTLLLVVLLVLRGEAARGGCLMYVGTYTGKGSEGIYAYRFDPASGEVRPLGLAARTENPSFLAADPQGRFLAAVNELDTFMNRPTGAVSLFSIERESGTLTPLQQVPSLGCGPAHLSLDRTARFLLVANYGSGNTVVFPIGPDGRLGQYAAFEQIYGSSVNAKRQAGPHAHAVQVTPDNRFAIVADLGVDKLLVYDFNQRTGALTLDSHKVRSLDPGAGPRHFAFAPSGSRLYVVNELSSSVTVFAYDAADGSLEQMQTISTLPIDSAGTNTAAEIVVDSRGRFLYVSNRGDDSVVVFSIDPGSGSLTAVQRVPCGGRTPRHIALDPTGQWLFSANQETDTITLFRVGPDDGRLTATSRSVTVVSPVCVICVSQP